MSKHTITTELKWDIHNAFNDIIDLKLITKDEKSTIPETHTKKLVKIERWLTKLNYILNKIDAIEKELLPTIEAEFQYHFESLDLVKLSFFRPKIKNLFIELQLHLTQTQIGTIGIDFETLVNLGEAAEVIALIGDSALDLAAAQYFWEPKLSDAGNITKKRSQMVSNENLAKACDHLNLYAYAIPSMAANQFSKEETIEHVKSTLVEALYGIIYIEKGIDAVFKALIVIK
ncbi:MAG: ribonuclease III domain-containing protein [Promethearchaeota archaeon]